MNAYVHIGGGETLSLEGALLVYRGRRRSFVAWHEARRAADGGAPYLGEAQPVTTAFLRGLASGLGSRLAPEVLPENVLARTPDVLVWWSPGQRRPMFFLRSVADAERLNGRRFPHPPLVWKASGRDLWVRALAENERPSAATKLLTAPYWNVSAEDGWVCQGSMRAPRDASVAAIDLWERAFFQSEFTHPSGAARLTSHPEGFLGLWRSLAGSRKSFPSEYLTSAREESVEEFVSRSSRE